MTIDFRSAIDSIHLHDLQRDLDQARSDLEQAQKDADRYAKHREFVMSKTGLPGEAIDAIYDAATDAGPLIQRMCGDSE